MGYDPYWPTCLASINTLCIPVTSISNSRFDEIYQALRRAAQLDLADLGDIDRLGSDLINPSYFRKGSAIFNFSKDSPDPQLQRFPFELNAQPQVVLGIHDVGHSGDADTNLDLQTVTARLQSSFRWEHSSPICAILSIGGSSSTDDAVISMENLDDEHVYNAMKFVYARLITHLSHLSERLADIPFANPGLQGGLEAGSAQPAATEATTSQAGQDQTHHGPQQVQKGRYTFAIGLLNLYVGSWLDAVRRLDEAAAIARQNEDPLWQARSLETLLMCMLMLASRNIDFTVPEVCIRAFNTSQMMSKSSFFGRPASVTSPLHSKADAELSPIEKWSKYTPVVAQAVLNIYTDLSSAGGSSLPQTILTESRIRVINLLVFASKEVNTSQAQNFELFLLHQQHPAPSVVSSAIAISTAAGISIPNILLAALPKAHENYMNSDELAATVAIVSCLSALGSLRRHAFILREILPRLAQTFTRARKVGASEAGVHPESTLTSIGYPSHPSPSGISAKIRPLLEATTAAYGLLIPTPANETCAIISTEELAANLKSWSEHHIDGDLNLKTEVLLQCIDVCDALPDPEGRLQLTSMLLRLAVQSVTVSAKTANPPPSLSANRQGRLIEGLKRTADAALKAGNHGMRASYWDDFLVRDAQVFQAPNAATLNSHAPSELTLVDSQAGSSNRDPFIFNPFARNTAIQAAPVVVAEELITFAVLLQNPLEVEIDVSNIELATEGCDFQPSSHSVVLGPLCSQIFKLTGKALSGGQLKVMGCRVTIHGCHPQTYPVLRSDWHLPLKTKQKSITSRRRANDSVFSIAELNIPEACSLSLTVIESQPILEVQSSSLPQPSLMLLEGEKRRISLHLKNASRTVSSDFLLLSSNDNVSRDLRTTLSRKDIQPIDTYEVQHQLKHRPVVHIPSGQFASRTLIGPQETSTCDVEVWGRPGLTDVSIHVDFANLKKPRSEIRQTFYTRQVRCPITLTVNGSIDIVRCNMLPIQGNLPHTSMFSSDYTGEVTQNGSSGDATSLAATKSMSETSLCMLSLDLRNVWPQPLTVKLTSSLQPDSQDSPRNGEEVGERYTVSDVIQPGHINRVILLVPRLFIENPFAPIPNLDTKKQFVLNAPKLGAEAEANTRENFWYREALLKHISGIWEELKTGRGGEIDIRKGIRLNLNARMIDVLRVDHVEISYSLVENAKAQTRSTSTTELENSHYSLETEAFVTLRVRIRNLSKDTLPLLIRLQPSLRGQPHNIALDLSRRLGWSGVLQRVLHPPLEPGDERTAELGLVAYAAGLYEINATVEEITPRPKPASDPSEGLDFDGHRRLWHARTPCLIDAVDPPQTS